MFNSSKAIEALCELSEALAMGPSRSAFTNLANLVVDTMPGRAATLVVQGKISAEVGFPLETHAELARAATTELATLAETQARLVEVPDTRKGPFSSRDTGVRLHASGYTGAYVAPIIGRETTFGTLVVWFDELYRADAESRKFLECVAYQLAVALTRDTRPAQGEVSLSSLGEMNRLASLGLLIDSSLHALRAPSSSLLIQIDELRRLTSELSILVDPTDSAIDDVIREFKTTVDDMGVASSVVRKELLRLSDASESRSEAEAVTLSLVLHEAVRIARPELEQQGFTLEETFARDNVVTGDRHEILQACLGSILAIARDPQIHGRFPQIDVHLSGNELEALIKISASASMSHFMPPLASAPENVASAMRTMRGEVTEGLGSITIRLPVNESSAQGGTSGFSRAVMPKLKKILLVDDDPMFARALRRALNPHDVRLCGTAAEVEIALIDPNYSPDLVICDLWLPGTNGRQLHEKVIQTRPELSDHFLFVSGAPMTSRDLEYFAAHRCESLTKPISIDDILSRLGKDDDGTPLSKRFDLGLGFEFG